MNENPNVTTVNRIAKAIFSDGDKEALNSITADEFTLKSLASVSMLRALASIPWESCRRGRQ